MVNMKDIEHAFKKDKSFKNRYVVEYLLSKGMELYNLFYETNREKQGLDVKLEANNKYKQLKKTIPDWCDEFMNQMEVLRKLVDEDAKDKVRGMRQTLADVKKFCEQNKRIVGHELEGFTNYDLKAQLKAYFELLRCLDNLVSANKVGEIKSVLNGLN